MESGQIQNLEILPPRERAPGTHWIGGWEGPRAGLDAVEKRKILWPSWELLGSSTYEKQKKSFNKFPLWGKNFSPFEVHVRCIQEELLEYTWCICITFYTHLIWFFAFNRLNFQVMEVEINLEQSKYIFNALTRNINNNIIDWPFKTQCDYLFRFQSSQFV
jgi:hypothetical protein